MNRKKLIALVMVGVISITGGALALTPEKQEEHKSTAKTSEPVKEAKKAPEAPKTVATSTPAPKPVPAATPAPAPEPVNCQAVKGRQAQLIRDVNQLKGRISSNTRDLNSTYPNDPNLPTLIANANAPAQAMIDTFMQEYYALEAKGC